MRGRMLITMVLVGIVIAGTGYVASGRLAGLTITVLYTATISFFLMPPFLSFRVSRNRDIAALALYGAAGLVLSRSAPSKRKHLPAQSEQARGFLGFAPNQTEISSAVDLLMESQLGEQLRALEFEVSPGAPSLPCSGWEFLR